MATSRGAPPRAPAHGSLAGGAAAGACRGDGGPRPTLIPTLYSTQVAMVKPGDASMASPFTAKRASVMPCTDIIRQGRSTLVTTVQMFKILGLTCLSTAYSLSVMYLQARRRPRPRPDAAACPSLHAAERPSRAAPPCAPLRMSHVRRVAAHFARRQEGPLLGRTHDRAAECRLSRRLHRARGREAGRPAGRARARGVSDACKVLTLAELVGHAASRARVCMPCAAAERGAARRAQGVKLGDLQATLMGMASAALFFVISHAKPLARLSPQRPHPDIFSLYVFASILGQFAVHLFFLATTYRGALAAMPPVRGPRPARRPPLLAGPPACAGGSLRAVREAPLSPAPPSRGSELVCRRVGWAARAAGGPVGVLTRALGRACTLCTPAQPVLQHSQAGWGGVLRVSCK